MKDVNLQAGFFKTRYTDFEEMYVIVDTERGRIHISSVTYEFSITLDLNKNLLDELENQMKWKERNFSQRLRNAVAIILEELELPLNKTLANN